MPHWCFVALNDNSHSVDDSSADAAQNRHFGDSLHSNAVSVFYEQVIDACIAHPGRILGIAILLIAVIGSGAVGIKFNRDNRMFFSPENPQLQALEALEATYSKDDTVLFVIAPTDGVVFSKRTLSLIKQLTERSWQVPYSTRVDSITNFQYTHADGEDFVVEDLVGDVSSLSPDDLLRIRNIAINEPRMRGRLVSPTGHVAAVYLSVQMPGIDLSAENPKVVSFMESTAESIRARYPDVDVYLNGMIMMNNAFSESSRHDSQTLVPGLFAAVVLGILLLVRSVLATLSIVFVAVASIVVALGFAGWLGIDLSSPSAPSPIIIMTVAIASSIHILIAFLRGYAEWGDKTKAIRHSMSVNSQPVFLASVTTALGFLSITASESPPFRDLGIIVAVGIVASYLAATLVLPALLTLAPIRKPPRPNGASAAMALLARWVIRRRRVLLASLLVIVAATALGLPLNDLDDSWTEYFDSRVSWRRASDFTEKNLGGQYSIDYSVHARESGGISDPDFLRDLDRFVQWYRNRPEVTHVASLTDTIKQLNMNMHGDDSAWYRLPDDRESSAQFLLLYEMSLPYGLDLNSVIDVDRSSTRVRVNMTRMSVNEVLAMERQAQAWLESNSPSLRVDEGTGPTMMFAHIGYRNIRSMLWSISLALVFISLFLIIAFRSLKMGLVSLVPNLLPVAMGFGLWGYLVGQIGLGLSVVAGMTMGIVVDDTIHFMSKYVTARREAGKSSPDAVRFAFSSVGTAMWMTTAVLVAGFAVIALSTFRLNADLGLLAAVTLLFALAADFLLLPPLLMAVDSRKDETTSAAATTHSSPTGC
jgi:predicted RND superfamily exporter protein